MWRDVLCRYGIGDVASAVFADQYGCWGFLDLWRNDTSAPFSAADAGFLAAVAAPLATALRQCQARTFVDPATPHRPDLGPVVLMLDDDLRIASRTAASRAWLDALLPPVPDQEAIPASVYNVAAQLLAVEKGVDAHPAFARTHLADGFWLALRAARLSSDQPLADRAATIVVTIEEASASERLELFGRAFGLSVREDELLGLLATGCDTRSMARQMSLSEHTIQDHLEVDLCQDRRPRSRYRPVARPRHQTLGRSRTGARGELAAGDPAWPAGLGLPGFGAATGWAALARHVARYLGSSHSANVGRVLPNPHRFTWHTEPSPSGSRGISALASSSFCGEAGPH